MMEARKRKASAKKAKRRPAPKYTSLTKKKRATGFLVKEDAPRYATSLRKPKQAARKTPTSSSKKEIKKKLKALKQLSGMFKGLWPLEDAQEYVNRLRSNE